MNWTPGGSDNSLATINARVMRAYVDPFYIRPGVDQADSGRTRGWAMVQDLGKGEGGEFLFEVSGDNSCINQKVQVL